VIDNGPWDTLDEQERPITSRTARNPVLCIETDADIAQGMLFGMTDNLPDRSNVAHRRREAPQLSWDLRASPLSETSSSSKWLSQMRSGTVTLNTVAKTWGLVVSVMPCPHFGGPEKRKLK
jgi:hypothetical protein